MPPTIDISGGTIRARARVIIGHYNFKQHPLTPPPYPRPLDYGAQSTSKECVDALLEKLYTSSQTDFGGK